MRLRAGIGLLCLVLSGCAHLPDQVEIQAGEVRVGPCRCALPAEAAGDGR